MARPWVCTFPWTCDPRRRNKASSIRPLPSSNLQKLEDTLWLLAPPKWPEEVLGKIDRQKAARGKILFADNCAGCHNSYPYTWTEPNKYGKRFLQVGLLPAAYMGTDKQQLVTVKEFMITGDLSAYLPPPYTGEAVVPADLFKVTLARRLAERAVEPLKLSEAQAADLNGFREFPLPPPTVDKWKAAPRDGVWATPPFLHNGSVPSLYEMLIPAKERHQEVLRRPRIRSGQSGGRHQWQVRDLRI